MADALQGWEVVVLDHGMQLPTHDDNVDVEVRSPDGEAWTSTFFTLRNVARLMEHWRSTGEAAGGTYFWGGPGAVLVEELSHEVIVTAIADLVSTGELQDGFQRIRARG